MNATTITTGKVRFSYCHFFTPVAAQGSDQAKYSVSVIIPKSDEETLKRIKTAIEEAKKAGQTSKWEGKIPAKLHTPLKDGDEEKPDDPAYANSYYFNCSSKNQPAVVDRALQPIIDPTEVYSGCYGRVNVNFYAYNFNGVKGVAAGLNSVQKLEDGQPLGGTAPSVAEAFGEDDMLD